MPYEVLTHTADLRLKVTAKTLEELFEEAMHGLMHVIHDRPDEHHKEVRRVVSVQSPDETALLVDFLNEVLFFTHIKHEIYTDLLLHEFTPRSLEAEVQGATVHDFDEDIKAVTYHEAKIEKNEKGEWEVTLVLDI